MKFILILVTWYLCFIQIIDSRKYRLILNDEPYDYIIDKTVPSFKEYVSTEHLIFEQIDDDYLELGGYLEWKKSMDPRIFLQANLRTQHFEKGIWTEGALRLVVPDSCSAFLNPKGFWYNVTKLFTNCPAQKGDKWLFQPQNLNMQIDLPPSFSRGLWRGFIIFSQGLFGEIIKFGVMFEMDLVDVV